MYASQGVESSSISSYRINVAVGPKTISRDNYIQQIITNVIKHKLLFDTVIADSARDNYFDFYYLDESDIMLQSNWIKLWVFNNIKNGDDLLFCIRSDERQSADGHLQFRLRFSELFDVLMYRA